MAEESGFHIFLTGDQSPATEQNFAGKKLAVLALSAQNWPIIKHQIPTILSAIESATPTSLRLVECGSFNRKKGRRS